MEYVLDYFKKLYEQLEKDQPETYRRGVMRITKIIYKGGYWEEIK